MTWNPTRGTRRQATALLLGTLAACAGRAEAPRADSAQATVAGTVSPGPAVPEAAASVLLVQLERGPCMGRCPEYRVALFSDGRVQYHGATNTVVPGEQSAQVASDAVRRLHADLLAAGAATADGAYSMGHPVCTAYIADLPTAVLSVQVNGTLKRILYDPGCQGAPAFLAVFPARIDSLAGTAPWVRGPSEKTP